MVVPDFQQNEPIMANKHTEKRSVTVQGDVAPGFELVREAFEENFILRGEVGAAYAVFQRGQKLVDLWGGWRDKARGLPWEENTMALVASSTKGITAAVIAFAHSQDWIDFEEKVATYWPEFAQNGKNEITIRQLFAHQAGLITLDGGFGIPELADLDGLAVRLAKQKPYWTPGDYQGYHAFTIGMYTNELLRRIDPQKRTVGQVLQDEIVGPMGGGFYIGLPANIDPRDDIAQLETPTLEQYLRFFRHMQPSEWKYMLSMGLPWTDAGRITFTHRIRSFQAMMNPQFLRIEVPAGNGVGTARAIAQIYDRLANPGPGSFISPETLDLLREPPRPPKRSRIDRVLHAEMLFSLGFVKPSRDFKFGSDDAAFGALGGGGSFGFADPTMGIGAAYVPNYFDNYIANDPRELALRNALYACLNSGSE